ncbi:MAG: hypothetical protein E7536_08995 [Ruminococcaceae bacterium]|nr:hypothetical protein [Oscillospiraceae bacterium]
MSDKLALELKEAPEPLKMQLSSNTHGGVILDGLPVYVVDALPDNPEVGDIVALNTTSATPWDQVKVWSRDEVPYKEEGAVTMCEHLPFEGSFVADAVPETLDFSEIEQRLVFASGVIMQGSNGALDISIDNIRGANGYDVFVIIYDHYKDIRYIYNKESWQASREGSNPVAISAQDIKLPDLSDVVVLDYFCTMTDDEFMQYESIADIHPEPALSIISQLGAITHEAGFYIAEELSGGCIWQRVDKKTAKQLLSLTAQTTEATANASKALTQSNKALSQAIAAQNQVADYVSRLNTAEQTSKAAHNIANSAQQSYNQLGPKVEGVIKTAENTKSQTETNTKAIAELQTAVNGYSTFLEEINGEVVEDE